MLLIGAAGFKEQELGGPHLLEQPDSATLMIRLIMSFAPLLLMSVGIFISLRYKIDAKKQKEMTEVLQGNVEVSESLENIF
jgi:Na+/melibiose symporter-like transporter